MMREKYGEILAIFLKKFRKKISRPAFEPYFFHEGEVKVEDGIVYLPLFKETHTHKDGKIWT